MRLMKFCLERGIIVWQESTTMRLCSKVMTCGFDWWEEDYAAHDTDYMHKSILFSLAHIIST